MSEPILIPAGNASAWTGPTGNNTWLLPGRVPALIDAGVGHAEHVAAVAAALDGRTLARILITHGHGDHVGGIPAIEARWPGIEVIAAPDLKVVARVTPDLKVGPTDVEAGDSRLRVIPTPGHSPDHVCFFDEGSGDLFCGDLLRRGGSIVIPASTGGDVAQYLDSLRRVRALGARRLLPGHGPIVSDPDGLIDEYIRHREERERQVAAALGEGLTTAAEIARRIYGRLPEPLARAAADTVQAHMNRLADQK